MLYNWERRITINKTFRKSIGSTILLAILLFSFTAYITPFAQADSGGTGKFLTIIFDGEGKVTATKVQSGEIRTFTIDDPAQKLGAGTVELLAIPNEGWEFSHWSGKVSDTDEIVTNYKTVKYGEVTVVFVKKTFTITATVAPEAPNGIIWADGVSTPITYQLDVIVDSGASQTFSFEPDPDNHVTAFQVDNPFVPYDLDYTFLNVQSDHTITVFFSLDGEAYIPDGITVPVNLGNDVSLSFISTQGASTATQEELFFSTALLNDTSLILWDVKTGVNFDGIVEIALPYTGLKPTQVFTSDSLDALYSDVNADGVVNADDVSDVAKGIKTTSQSGAEYNAQWDVNRDGELTEDDIHMVNDNKGTILESLNFWVEGDTLYIETDHFSIFRGR